MCNFQQMQKIQHMYWWASVKQLELKYKKINYDWFQLAGKLELGHDTGFILTTVLSGMSLHLRRDHALATKWKEESNGLLGEYQSY